ncbi:efflux transporter outer membrane subunit [Mangrovibacterium diazotrophicum]|uniref:NodT family efflux transporter outer membrane factor (OMF) lipoprotein n=1 Tax=Mangrovibacterium diazotrophicum TaxID=1261403 RepID=A0A419WBV8_9BACT|nr:TolC family protein [Mangrovibacterium diazotrophicum]RKD92894.1 NodT family efflux transporter outer membrane factor (OMF) lipoprotein [Mangrovibacterium diazotrophicum]
MKTNSFKNIILAVVTAATLYSCSGSRHYERSPESTDGLYNSSVADSTSNLANESWDKLFNDPILDTLIAEGLRNNLDLQAAIQRVKASEAYFKQGRAAMLPSLSAQAGYTYVRNSESTYPDGPREYQGQQLSLEASWEIDIWGKLNTAKKAAYADYLGTDAARKAVQTSLISSIATAYYNLLALDSQLKITKETVVTNANLVETMKILKDQGNVTGAAVVQSEAARYAAEVTIPDLEQQIKAAENTLSLLLGRTPGPIARGKLEDQQANSMLTIGVPSELLDNRPDVMQAEYAVISAFEMRNNAKAYFYPSVTLTATGGFESLDWSELLDPGSFMATVVGGLAEPIFNKRANRTRLEVAEAQKQEALLSFKSTLLNAGAEVNNALNTYDASVRKMELRQKQLESLEKSVEYTKELLTYGSATYTEVLNAQQSLLAAQLSNVSDHIQKLNAVVTLYRALGGGWK